jgi:hypothetical protein
MKESFEERASHIYIAIPLLTTQHDDDDSGEWGKAERVIQGARLTNHRPKPRQAAGSDVRKFCGNSAASDSRSDKKMTLPTVRPEEGGAKVARPPLLIRIFLAVFLTI